MNCARFSIYFMKVCVYTKSSDFETVKDGRSLGPSLRWYLSIAGDTSVKTSPMSPTQQTETHAYRFDWMVGLACCSSREDEWDWQARLRDEDALKVQILLKAPPGITWSDLSAELLALHPSRNTTSWIEDNAGEALQAASALASLGGSAIPGLALGAQFLNAIPSGTRQRRWLFWRRRHWYLYRYFDVLLDCPGVEWVVSKNVMRQYGPMLRGSLALAFHGEPAVTGSPATMYLRAGLGIKPLGDLSHVIPGGDTEPLLQLPIQFETKIASTASV
jgi:hypothetical protein